MGTRSTGRSPVKIKIGMAVEGPSDRLFLKALFERLYPSFHLDIRIMKGRSNLIKCAEKLLTGFRNSNYRAGLILIDQDKDDSIEKIQNQFSEGIRNEIIKNKGERYLSLIVVKKDLESWFLADEKSINVLLPKCNYRVSCDTSQFNKRTMCTLWAKQHPNSDYNEISFAKDIGRIFNPKNAVTKSCSLKYFLETICDKL